MKNLTSNIYVLGAGFSAFSGLPLGKDIFSLVIEESKKFDLYGILERDIENFLIYYNDNNKEPIDQNEINFEEFLSYLDIQDFLGLEDTSDYSRRTQNIIRNLIGRILYLKQKQIKENDFLLYEYFIENIDNTDVIITFNYDTIVERCLEKMNKPFRLFNERFIGYDYQSLGKVYDKKIREVILLKMHGSIDWFDIGNFYNNLKKMANKNNFGLPKHPIFRNEEIFTPEKIISGPCYENSPLNRIYRVKNLYEYYDRKNVLFSPLIISPSLNKIVNLNPLIEFWESFYYAGLANKKIVFIGFSLPKHDDYIRHPFYYMVKNFQESDALPPGRRDRMKMIDYRKNDKEISEFKDTYSFVDWNKTDCHFDGFNEEAIKFIFEK